MAKKTSTPLKDALLNHARTRIQRAVICSAEPANYAGVAAVTLGDIAYSSTDIGAPADNGTGRRAAYGTKTAIDVDANGTANHIAFVRDAGGDTELILVTTISNPQAVTAGNTMSFSAFNHDIGEVS
jgi:hypothetical protein